MLLLGAHLHPGRLDYSPVWFRDVQVRGVYAHGLECFQGESVPTLALALRLLAGAGRLPVNFVRHRVALAEYGRGAEWMAEKGRSRAVRVAVVAD